MSGQPRRVGESLDRISQSIGAGDASTLASVFARWPEVVGASLAARTRPLTIRDTTLVVAVDDPAWATQLRWLGDSVLVSLRAAIAGCSLDAIQVVVRPS